MNAPVRPILEGITTDGEIVPVSFRGRVLQVGWELPADMTEPEWLAAGATLGKVERSVSWWVGDWWAFGEARYGQRKAIVEANDWEGPDFKTCANAASVCKKFETSRRREVLSFKHHSEVAALPASAQDALLDWAEEPLRETGKPRSTIELRGEVFRRKTLGPRPADFEGCTVEDLNGLISAGKKYSVIYADPPWEFKVYSGKGKARSADRHYKADEETGKSTMSIEDLKALPITELAADDCALFMWAVLPELPGALELISAWGFTYKTVAFTWIKQNKSGLGLFWGMGYWTRANAEVCLLATRGAPKRQAMDVHQVIMSPVSSHSRKPDEAQVRIEKLLNGPYLELFARRATPNWTCWGNEVSRSLLHQSIPEFVA